MVAESPIDQLLTALDGLDADEVTALFAPDVRVLTADGRRAAGIDAARELISAFIGQLRSTSHTVTARWHEGDTWIAEVDSSYELRDRLLLRSLPRAFFLRVDDTGILELRTYGAHEHALADHRSTEHGVRVGGRWVPPL